MSTFGHTMSNHPRGGNGGGSSSKHQGGGAAFNSGRDRGQNINHLLSFTLPPRARPPPPPAARRSRRGGASQPFNKERYVSAQYRFLVKPTGDYTAYFADADIYLNWGDILTVLIPTSSALSGASTSSSTGIASQPSLETHEGAACPICLSPPTAPRMTKCGHVYCYPCILQYLATTDGPSSASPAPVPGASSAASVNSGNALQGPSNRQWKRCPICWDAVYARDLKAVKWWDPQAIAQSQVEPAHHHESSWLRMRLVERPQITTLALPQSSTWPTSSTSPSDQPLLAQHQAPWHFQPDVMTFCKFMLATPELLLESLTHDVDELAEEKKLLQSLGAHAGDNSAAFADLAEKKVREQMAKVVNELDTPAVRSAIGQAQNDLREHAEAEQSRRLRDHENLSRRQRRQRERQEQQRQAEEGGGDDPKKVEAAEGAGEGKAVEATEGAEAFLALKSSGQGGSYASGQPQAPTSAGEGAPASDAGTSPPKQHTRPKRNINPPAPSASSFLFYQAASGQNIFLHPLDIKIMHSQFGAYSRFPRDIAVKVQSAEEGSMNEELRKRCRYLTHLPKATDVVFIEVDWDAMASGSSGDDSTPALVDRSTLRQYDQILKARRNKRRDRERKEDRAKLKAEQAEAASRPGAQSAAGAMARNRQAQHRSEETGAGGLSPTFMESAMWGAEREFPIHPGRNEGGDEDFPAPAPSSHSPHLAPTQAPAPTNGRRTVWGTPAAAESSFSSTLHASSRRSEHAHEYDDDIDDAWLELEEGFVLGTNNSRQVRAGRGLNGQQGQSQRAWRGGGSGGSNGGQQQQQQQTASTSTPTPTPTPTTGKKQRKAKLVLTSGGRGTG